MKKNLSIALAIMSNLKIKWSIIVFACMLQVCTFDAIAQEPLKVLFIGNSFTYYADLPGTFKALCTAAGQTVTVDSYATAGASVTQGYSSTPHVTNPLVYAKIHSQVWDYVVIQENGAFFSQPIHQFTANPIPDNIRLRDSVKAINPCSSVIWFATWGPVGGGGEVANDNTIKTIDRIDTNMQWLNKTYPAKEEIIAPFGRAWKAAIAAKSSLLNSLYNGDQVHPAAAGQLLNASVLYTTLFKQDPSNVNYTAGVNAVDAALLRSTGYQTVMTNYIYATHNLGSITPVITNNSGVLSIPATYASYQWYNNNVAIAGATSSTYTPSTTGSFCVIATDSNGCKHFQSFTVNTSAAGTEEFVSAANILVYPNPMLSIATLTMTDKNDITNCELKLFDVIGNEVHPLIIRNSNSLVLQRGNLASGVYYYKIISKGTGINSGKLVIE